MAIDIHMSKSVELLKPTLSPTALDNFEVCGRRAQFYLDPDIPGRTTLGLAKGRAWHYAMEQFNRVRMWAQGNGTPLFTSKGLVALDDEWLWRLETMMLGYLAEQVTRDDFVWDEADDWNATTKELLLMLRTWAADPNAMWVVPTREGGASAVLVDAIEVLVHTEMGSEHHQMKGYIDVVYDWLDEPLLVDYKTASRRWGSPKVWVDDETGRTMGDARKLIQAPLYAEAWMRATGQQVRWMVYDIMTKAGAFQRVWVDVSPDIREPLLTRWQDVSATIHLYQEAGLDLPTNPGHHLCSPKWCAYWDRCPMGAALDDRIKRRLT